MEKLKLSKRYDLYYEQETDCYRLLQFDKKNPYMQGMTILTIPKETLIDLIVNHQEEI